MQTENFCPKYVDYVRECICEIDCISNEMDTTLRFCISGNYTDCPFFHFIENPDTGCEYFKTCSLCSHFKEKDLDHFVEMCNTWCLNDFISCARYKIKQSGETPATDLHPAGHKLQLRSPSEKFSEAAYSGQPRMKYRQIIWDWNGTLWDDTRLCVEINNHMLERRELPPITIDTYRAKLCFPVTDYYCQLGFDYAVDPYTKLAEEFIEEYHRRRFECPLHADALDTLSFFQTLEIPQAVLSAYEQKALLEATDYFELTPLFTDIIGLNDIYAHGKVENGKQYIAEQDVDPSEVLFIGDTIHDFEVAEAMGINCALIANGHNSRERLAACGVPMFDSLAGLREFISCRTV